MVVKIRVNSLWQPGSHEPMQAAWLVFRIRNSGCPGWQRRRACNLGIPRVMIKNTNLRLLIHYALCKKVWN